MTDKGEQNVSQTLPVVHKQSVYSNVHVAGDSSDVFVKSAMLSFTNTDKTRWVGKVHAGFTFEEKAAEVIQQETQVTQISGKNG